MSRRDGERFADILDAIEAIRNHLQRGDLSDGLVYDAIRVRLIEIGEAVKSIPAEVVATDPERLGETSLRCGTAWRTATSTPCTRSCRSTLENDLPPLERAVLRLQVATGSDPAP
jgi:hypothetical protein